MKVSASSVIGWICTVLVAAFNVFAGVMKFMPVPAGSPQEQMMQQLGISLQLDHILGVLELVSVVLYLIPRTSVVGFVLLIGYTGGALATNLTHGFTAMQAMPIYVLFALMTLDAWLRKPELTARLMKG